MTSKTSIARLLCAIFGTDVCGHISQITSYFPNLYFSMGIFLQVPPIFRKHFFLDHLCTMASLCSLEKDSITTTRDSFKHCILACKIRNQMHTNFEKFHKQSVLSLLKNGCSVTIFIALFVENFLEHIRSSSYLLGADLFEGKFTFTWTNYSTAISVIVTLHQFLWRDIF